MRVRAELVEHRDLAGLTEPLVAEQPAGVRDRPDVRLSAERQARRLSSTSVARARRACRATSGDVAGQRHGRAVSGAGRRPAGRRGASGRDRRGAGRPAAERERRGVRRRRCPLESPRRGPDPHLHLPQPPLACPPRVCLGTEADGPVPRQILVGIGRSSLAADDDGWVWPGRVRTTCGHHAGPGRHHQAAGRCDRQRGQPGHARGRGRRRGDPPRGRSRDPAGLHRAFPQRSRHGWSRLDYRREAARPLRHPRRRAHHGAGETDRSLLTSCYARALEVAGRLGVETIAFPLVSAGIYAWPLQDAANAAVETLRSVETPVSEARLVAFGPTAYDALQVALSATSR